MITRDFSVISMTSQASLSLSLSLSLLLTKVTHAQYRKRFRASYNETRNFRDRGPIIGGKRGGGVGKLDSTSSLHLDKDPRRAQEVRAVQLYSSWSAARSADVFDPGTACLRGSGLLVPRHPMATVGCLMPASVYSCVARKRKLQNWVNDLRFLTRILTF